MFPNKMTSHSNNNGKSFALRRTVVAPYIFLPAILILITLMNIPYMIRTHDLTPVGILSVGLVLFVFPITYMDSRYRVWWRDGQIVMRAAGFPWSLVTVTMRVEDIDRIQQETSNAHTLVKMNRPFRRIALYGRTTLEGRNFIDISLKHFNLDDVRKLLKVIHERRPDLVVPKVDLTPGSSEIDMNQVARNGLIGQLILWVAVIGFFFSFGYFHLSGWVLDRNNLSSLPKMMVTTAFLPVGLYFGLCFISGKKLANQIGGGLAVFLIASYVLGFLLH